MKKGLCYTVSANTQIGRDPMTIITEDMRFRKRLCEFAQKHGVINAARRYKTNRMFVYRQLARFDGSLESLRLKSTKPNSHPNQHTSTEKILLKKHLFLINRMVLQKFMFNFAKEVIFEVMDQCVFK